MDEHEPGGRRAEPRIGRQRRHLRPGRNLEARIAELPEFTILLIVTEDVALRGMNRPGFAGGRFV